MKTIRQKAILALIHWHKQGILALPKSFLTLTSLTAEPTLSPSKILDPSTNAFSNTKALSNAKPVLNKPSPIIEKPLPSTIAKDNPLVEPDSFTYNACLQCPQNARFIHTMTGVGNLTARIVLIGDYPSEQDYHSQLPFSHEVGNLLLKMLLSIKIDPSQVYFTNCLKCYTPSDESDLKAQTQCLSILKSQIKQINPHLILLLGQKTLNLISSNNTKLIKGKWFKWGGIQTIAICHPRDLMLKPELKRTTWLHLKQVETFLGEGAN